jgi:hypothetical protein
VGSPLQVWLRLVLSIDLVAAASTPARSSSHPCPVALTADSDASICRPELLVGLVSVDFGPAGSASLAYSDVETDDPVWALELLVGLVSADSGPAGWASLVYSDVGMDDPVWASELLVGLVSADFGPAGSASLAYSDVEMDDPVWASSGSAFRVC